MLSMLESNVQMQELRSSNAILKEVYINYHGMEIA